MEARISRASALNRTLEFEDITLDTFTYEVFIEDKKVKLTRTEYALSLIHISTLTTDENGNTDVAEVTAGTVYIKELSAPAGHKVDKTVYPLTIKAGKTATLNVSDTPKVTDTLIELFKIDMETQKDNPQGNASLAGAEFTWKYYAGFYNKDNLPAEATRTWVTKTIAETDSDGTTHYITKSVSYTHLIRYAIIVKQET